MKEQYQLLSPLAIEPEPKRRFTIKKLLLFVFTAYIVYYIIGMVSKRLFWKPNTVCTYNLGEKQDATCDERCHAPSRECRKSCSVGDVVCYRKCYDIVDLYCYDPCYGRTIPKIDMCETTYKLVFEF